MIHKVLGFLSRLREFRQLFSDNDDCVDRLHRLYTCCFLLLSASMVGLKQFAGAPIDCWCPGQFSPSHVSYANSICWVNGTYYVPLDDYLPLPNQSRTVILYYQWVPFLLLIQAFVFTLPGFFWRAFSSRLGMNLSSIIGCMKTTQCNLAEGTIYSGIKCQKGDKQAVIRVASYLRGKSQLKRSWRNDYHFRNNDGMEHCDIIGMERTSYSSGFIYFCNVLTWPVCCLCRQSPAPGRLCLLFLTMKLLNLANTCFQFVWMNSFLNKTPHDSFIRTIATSLERISLEELVNFQLDQGRFPKVTMCDFHIRQQVNLHRYTVQCVLPINLFNEKVFLMLWVWLVLLFLITVLNLFLWTPAMFPCCQAGYIKQRLRVVIDSERVDSRSTKKFLTTYLGSDGVLALKLVASNSGEEGELLLLHGLWQDYRRHRPDRSGTWKGRRSRGHAEVSREEIQTLSFWEAIRKRNHRKKTPSRHDALPSDEV